MSALASLRPTAHSPTSSASSHTTTPTSPHFHHRAHPYASFFEPPDQSSLSLVTTTAISHPRPITPPLYYTPPNQSFSAYLRSWGPAEISAFLSVYKCGHYANLFQRNDIDGKVLLDLDMTFLKEIGVHKVGERVKLLAGIKDLRKRASAPLVELRLNGAATPPVGSPGVSPIEMRSRQIAPSATRRLNTTRPPPLDLQPHNSSRPLPQAVRATPRPIPSRPLLSQSSSSTTIAPSSSVPAPARNLSLRAPPSRDRRSPSPVTDASVFVDRPLPPPPGQQSSAAEYASSITQQRQHTPTNADPSHRHRQVPSIGTPPKPANDSKPRLVVAPHPFAAPREEKKASPPESSLGSAKRNPPGGYVVGSGGMIASKSSSSGERQRRAPSESNSQVPLEDIRRQVVRFINKEDGTTRTVNVASCSSGVEVLERVLKKFGKWNIGMSTDTESDEDGDRLEVDGWGVYAESDPDPEGESTSQEFPLTCSQTAVRGEPPRDLHVPP